MEEIFQTEFTKLSKAGLLTNEIISQLYSVMTLLTRRDEKESTRLGLYPIRDKTAWHYYKLQQQMFWPAHEIKFMRDREQFNDPTQITPRQRELFTKIIGFFMPADGAIIENIRSILLEVENLEETFYYTAQIYIETQHAEGYNNAAKAFFLDEAEFMEVKQMIDNSEPHYKKLEFIQRYSQSHLPKVLKLAASACMEGIFFMGLFPIIFYFIKLEKLPDFTQINEQIFKDESLHCEFYCKKVAETLETFTPVQQEDFKKLIIPIVQESVQIEQAFIRYILDKPVVDQESDERVGLTADNLCRFIEMMADQISVRFGIGKIYGTIQELPWTESSVMAIKTNKYEKDITTYSHTEAEMTTRPGRKLRF